ncbi:MAG: hypothetical protein FIA92_04270 [Chloroflexi bacterium]|nr:hypothetical protein [Chloroflexota bacterium]
MWTRPTRWWSQLTDAGRRSVLLAVLLLFVYGFFQQRPAWNEYSRYDLVRAIVEQGTTRIDSFHENTGDKAFYQGHWYSDKAPGTAILGVPVYALLSLTSQLTGADTPTQVEAVQALAFVESGVPTVVLVLLLVAFLRPFVGERWAVAVGLAYGLGSMAFPFATMFFGHAASTAALFGAFFLLHRHKARPGRWPPIAAGFLAGWAALIEIPVVLGVALLFVYALFLGRGVAARFVTGGLPLAAVLMAYNWLTFGSPFSIGYQYTIAFAEQNAQGLVSIVWPSLETAGELLFDPRGLIRLAPWLAVAPIGLLALRRREVRFELLFAAAMCVAFLTYNSGALNPFGGWTPGPRYLLPALPFAAVLVAFVPASLRVLAVPLMIGSAAVFLVATATMPNAPERYVDPLFELWLPRFLAGWLADTAAWIRWGLAGPATLAVLLMGLAFGIGAVALSFGRSAIAGRVPTRGSIALAALVLAFSFPFPPLAPLALGWGSLEGAPAISIIEVGQVPAGGRDPKGLELWARIENAGAAVSNVRLQFSTYRPTGEVVWTAWYGEATIEARSRRTVWMTWLPDDPPSGSYRYGFLVSDGVTGAAYAQRLAAEIVQLGP